MRARISLLRSAGVRQEPAQRPAALAGTLVFEADARGTRRLVLRAPMSAPGMGVLAALYQPSVVGVDHLGLTLRGIEQADAGKGRIAAVVQEWTVVVD